MQTDNSTQPFRVGICSTEPIRLEGLCSSFDGHATIQVVTGELKHLLADCTIRVLILDGLYSGGWMETFLDVRRNRPDIRQIVLGPSCNEDLVIRAIMAGARAYLDPKAGTFAIRQATETVAQGLIWAPRRTLTVLIDRLMTQSGLAVAPHAAVLSPREQQVLELIMTACSNREIAEELGIEERTVKAYVASLLRKTGSENRVALSVQATQRSIRESRGISG